MYRQDKRSYSFTPDEIFNILTTHLKSKLELQGDENITYGFHGELDVEDDDEIFTIYVIRETEED